MLHNDVIKSPYDIRDYTINAESNLPESFSLDLNIPVKDQGSRSTCVAHALSSIIEHHYYTQLSEYKEFSTEFIYGYRVFGNYEGEGMVLRQALKNIQSYGDVFYDDCPGNDNYTVSKKVVNENLDNLKDLAYPHRISSYFRINTADELKTALMKYGPVVISMNIYKHDKLVDDVYTHTSNVIEGRHCVFIYGWDERGWLVQNSWGTIYGYDGRFTIPYDFKLNEMWGIVDNIIDGSSIVKPKLNKLLNIIYKIINKIVNTVMTLIDKE